MKLANTFKAVSFVLFIFFMASCKKDDAAITGTGTVGLEFDHKVGSEALELGTKTYTNAHGDDFKVTAFKYYISNIGFKKADGSKVTAPESYHLVNAADPSSVLQTLTNVPAGDYTAIEFTIGLDETRNYAIAQTGALDPANGMYWDQNNGYIFLLFEGSSTKSSQASKELSFHVGGAKSPVNAIRTVSLNLPVGLRVRSNTEPEMHLFVDVSSLFKGTTSIDFASISNFNGGANSLLIADNYAAGLFTVNHIHN